MGQIRCKGGDAGFAGVEAVADIRAYPGDHLRRTFGDPAAGLQPSRLAAGPVQGEQRVGLTAKTAAEVAGHQVGAVLDRRTCLLGETDPSVVAEHPVRREPEVHESGSALVLDDFFCELRRYG